MSVPVKALRGAVSDACCFCGQAVEHPDSERITISARWGGVGEERTQDWEAHRKCLAERIHERVKDSGPFFIDD